MTLYDKRWERSVLLVYRTQLIDDRTLTRAPVILGEGIPLFGKAKQIIKLENANATAFPSDFVQLHYTVNYG
jgi:dihydrofolate reductase